MTDKRKSPQRMGPREANLGQGAGSPGASRNKPRRATRPRGEEDNSKNDGEAGGNPVWLLVGFIACLAALLAWAMTAS